MVSDPLFKAAFPFQDDVLALPVTDVDTASAWYCEHFAMTEVERYDEPAPTVILERDGIRVGFAVNGADPSQDGAAIRVGGLDALRAELASRGVHAGDPRVDENDDGSKQTVFFVVAPDGLCYYFHEPIGNRGPCATHSSRQ